MKKIILEKINWNFQVFRFHLKYIFFNHFHSIFFIRQIDFILNVTFRVSWGGFWKFVEKW